MKRSKNIITALAAVACLFTATSCSNDGDMVTVGKGDVVMINGSNIVKLDQENASALALTLFWNDNHQLSTNYKDVLVPNYSIKNTLQISPTADFAKSSTLQLNDGVYQKQYTHAELNSELINLGYSPFVEQDMYVRLASSTGSNIAPQYSNVMAFKVIPYKIDYTKARVLASDKSDTGTMLYSPTENGIYTGFMSLGAWGNWWLLEGDGTTWGNLDVDGYAFVATNSATAWNFWGSKHNGCRFVTVNTKQKYWTDHAIPTVTVGGDVTGEMTFDKATMKWMLTYDAPSTDPVNVTFTSSDAALYDHNTGTEEGIATPVYFTTDGITTDAAKAETFTLTPSAKGTATVTIDLAQGEKPVYSIEAGGSVIETVEPVLCIMGNDDKWDHTEWLRLSDEDNKTYTGAVNMASSWGFYFTKTLAGDDWTKINQNPDDASSNKLVEGGNDIAAPGTGLYILSASLGWMSYWYEMDSAPVTTVSYTGLNDDWSAHAMEATTTPGVYVATVTATADTPWGIQILINGSWDYWFGTKGDGTLVWKSKDNANPAGVEVGNTYLLTVDICHGTYTFNKQ